MSSQTCCARAVVSDGKMCMLLCHTCVCERWQDMYAAVFAIHVYVDDGKIYMLLCHTCVCE